MQAGPGPRVPGDESAACTPRQRPDCYVISYNVRKRHNLGKPVPQRHRVRCQRGEPAGRGSPGGPVSQPLLDASEGAVQLCLIGSRQFNTFGSHGAADHVSFRHFASLESCCSFLKDEKGEVSGPQGHLIAATVAAALI